MAIEISITEIKNNLIVFKCPAGEGRAIWQGGNVNPGERRFVEFEVDEGHPEFVLDESQDEFGYIQDNSTDAGGYSLAINGMAKKQAVCENTYDVELSKDISLPIEFSDFEIDGLWVKIFTRCLFVYDCNY